MTRHPRTEPSFSGVRQIAAVVVMAVLVAAPGVPQSATQPSQPNGQKPFTFKVESELVLVNVVARDKQGRPVTDLKKEDFTIFEEGKPQKISSFDFENLDTTPLSASAGPSQIGEGGKPVAPAKPLLTRKDAEEA